MIPDLLGKIFGADLVEMAVQAAMGQPILTTVQKPEGCYATHNLHSTKNGIYKQIVFSDELKKYLQEVHFYKKPGDHVERFDNAAKCLGIIFMKFPDVATAENILSHTYFSFMANMISEEHLTVVEDDVIADKFKTRYNMELPLPFIRQILGVGIQNGSFVEDHGKYSVVVNELAKYRFSETDFNKLWNQLINEFATYCRTQDIDISSLDISAFVAGILDDTGLCRIIEKKFQYRLI